MRCVIFTHSLVSDWNHGNAHFLRGVATELIARGWDLRIFEPSDGWSRANLLAEHGTEPIHDFERAYPTLRSILYDLSELNVNDALNGADMVLVHEWNDPELVRRIGQHRASGGDYTLFFHDTHHRSQTDASAIAAYQLRHYDGVLAYGAVIRDIYRAASLRTAMPDTWVWHEAADTRVFYPRAAGSREGDLVWIGNWGDEERTEELREFLIEPVKKLKLRATVYGVRYPASAIQELADASIEYRGWLPNFRVPEVFARYRVTVHVPRRPYAKDLPGIPTIRPFEAMACGIPLISAPWSDSENLFRPGYDFLFAKDGDEMASHLTRVLSDDQLARDLAMHGLETIRQRHTCSHRVEELLAIRASVREPMLTKGTF
jgi:spore maturation protein CgeB